MAPLLELGRLKMLQLWSCTLQDELPSLERLASLRVLFIDKLATRENLARIAAAPALRCLILNRSADLLDLDALRPLADHPTLEELRVDTFDERIQQSIRDRFGWKVEFSNAPGEEYLQD